MKVLEFSASQISTESRASKLDVSHFKTIQVMKLDYCYLDEGLEPGVLVGTAKIFQVRRSFSFCPNFRVT